MKKCIKLSVLLVGIMFLFIGKKVYAFDNDQTVSIQGFNMIAHRSWIATTSPFSTSNISWEPLTQNYIYGNFQYPRNTTPPEYSYVRALQGSFYSAMQPNKDYTIEIAVFHGQDFYGGQYGQGKQYDNSCSLQVSQGGVRNVACTYEQDTYITSGGIHYDRLRIYFTSSNNSYNSVLYTWQFGQINSTSYILINLLPGSISEDNYFGWDNVYIGYSNEDPDTSVGGKINTTNGLLSQIRDKIQQFKDMMERKMNNVISILSDDK